MTPLIQSAMYSDERFKHTTHYHNANQIIYIQKGEVSVEINGRRTHARSGDIIVISRFENHSITVHSDEYIRHILRISPHLPVSDSAFSLFTDRPESFSNVVRISDDKEVIENILSRIYAESTSDQKLSAALQNVLLGELLIYILRALPYEFGTHSEKSAALVIALKNEFENRFHESFSLDQLAKKHRVSVSTLTHTFKRIVGTSPFEYLLSCRIAAAKNYLINTDFPVGEIVDLCGFTDQSNFARTFKKLTGLSPLAFRKTYRETVQ